MTKKDYGKIEQGFDLYSEYADLTPVERMMLSPHVEKYLKEATIEGVVVDAQNVFDYMRTSGHDIEIHNVAPPYTSMVFQQKIEYQTLYKNVMSILISVPFDNNLQNNQHVKEILFEKFRNKEIVGSVDDTKWILSTVVIEEMIDPPQEKIFHAVPMYRNIHLVDGYGVHIAGECSLYNQDLYDRDVYKDHEEEIYTEGYVFMMSYLLSMSFMHCKNIKITECDKPPRTFSQHDSKKADSMNLKYNTINIEPMKIINKTESPMSFSGIKRSLHTCRGHFATYTAEKKLFGKVEGTFWIPQHVRGSKEYGEVVKDYNIQL